MPEIYSAPTASNPLPNLRYSDKNENKKNKNDKSDKNAKGFQSRPMDDLLSLDDNLSFSTPANQQSTMMNMNNNPFGAPMMSAPSPGMLISELAFQFGKSGIEKSTLID